MIPDDQGVTEEWILRVDGSEYGPANIETLREWKAEGRVLLQTKPVARIPSFGVWPRKFPAYLMKRRSPQSTPRGLTHSTSSVQPLPPLPPRGFGQILADTLGIYVKGFLQFLSLTLLVFLPSVCAQLTAMWMQTGKASDADPRVLAAGGFAFLMFIFSMAMWACLRRRHSNHYH